MRTIVRPVVPPALPDRQNPAAAFNKGLSRSISIMSLGAPVEEARLAEPSVGHAERSGCVLLNDTTPRRNSAARLLGKTQHGVRTAESASVRPSALPPYSNCVVVSPSMDVGAGLTCADGLADLSAAHGVAID
ncbi:hypothetical protein GCM10009609_48150 [Pseudonocardia aurantiaca]